MYTRGVLLLMVDFLARSDDEKRVWNSLAGPACVTTRNREEEAR